MTSEEKVKIYERVFHRISSACLTMDNGKVREIVSLIDNWSYAHRAGNGELTDEEQEAQINRALERLSSVS